MLTQQQLLGKDTAIHLSSNLFDSVDPSSPGAEQQYQVTQSKLLHASLVHSNDVLGCHGCAVAASGVKNAWFILNTMNSLQVTCDRLEGTRYDGQFIASMRRSCTSVTVPTVSYFTFLKDRIAFQATSPTCFSGSRGSLQSVSRVPLIVFTVLHL